jgi:hypothetical protein
MDATTPTVLTVDTARRGRIRGQESRRVCRRKWLTATGGIRMERQALDMSVVSSA